MNAISIRSRELFDSGYFCAESVVMAVAEYLKIDSELLPGLATGFCGGISRNGNLCGALTGGIMALGLAYGRKGLKDGNALVYAKVSRYIQEFELTLGSGNCTDLLGCDISTAEGSATFERQDLEARICAGITEKAGAILMTLLAPEDDRFAARR